MNSIKGIFFSMIILFILILFVKIETSISEKNPPPLEGGYSLGDWVIEDGDNILRNNQEIYLEGDLIIENGGKLSFKNVTFIMNCNGSSPEYAKLEIRIENGGEFIVLDNDNNSETKNDASLISMGLNIKETNDDKDTKNEDKFKGKNSEHKKSDEIPNKGFSFYVLNNGRLEMKNSILYECGYYFDLVGKTAGLQIESDDVSLSNNTLANNYYGIICNNSSPAIINNTILENKHDGIMCKDASPILESNIINNNSFGINIPYDSRETIKKMSNNYINGISIEGSYQFDESNTLIENWTFDSGRAMGYIGNVSQQGIITLYDCSNVTFINCNISYNDVGIYAYNSNAKIINLSISKTFYGIFSEIGYLEINDCKIYQNKFGFQFRYSDSILKNTSTYENEVGIYTKYSDPIIENCVIEKNIWDGIYSYKSNPEIRNSYINNNGKKGIAGYVSSIKIINNTIFKNKEYGIYSHNCTTKIEKNRIFENIDGIFCDLGENVINNNEIYANRNGIYVNYSNPMISNNQIFNNEYGILSYSFCEPQILNNLIYNNDYGIYTNTSTIFHVDDNKISGNVYGIFLEKNSRITMINNEFIENKIKGLYLGDLSYSNWEINNESKIIKDNISLNGHLFIFNNGNLTCNNANITFYPSYNGQCSIEVLDGGSIFISNSTNISTNIPVKRFNFRVQNGAKIIMTNSEIHHCGYSDFYTGLILETDDAIIEFNEISNNYFGIYSYRSSPIIRNNIISGNDKYGIYCFYSNATIKKNLISDNECGVMVSSSEPDFVENQILINKQYGIEFRGSVSRTNIKNSQILNNHIDIFTDYFARPTLINCTISNKMKLDRDSKITTINSTFRNIEFLDYNSTVFVKWFLNSIVKYPNGKTVKNADINIHCTDFIRKCKTNSYGIKKWLLVPSLKMSKNQTIYFYYSINVTNNEIYNQSNHYIDETKWINLILEDIVPPEIFDIFVTDITENSAHIGWKTNERSDSLVKYSKNSEIFFEENNQNFSYKHKILLNDLIDDTNYTFKVISEDKIGNSNTSIEYQFTTLKDKNPPKPIKNLQAIDTKKGGEIKLTWDESTETDFERYIIYRINQDIMMNIGTLMNKINTTFYVQGLINNEKYYFAVTSVDIKGNENKSAEIVMGIPTYFQKEIMDIVTIYNVEFPKKAENGEQIKIFCIIENKGDSDLKDLKIEIYFGTKLIDKIYLNEPLNIGKNETIVCKWIAESGNDKIKINVKNSDNEILDEYISEDSLSIKSDIDNGNFPFLLIFLLIILTLLILCLITPFGKNKTSGNKK